MPWYYAGPEAKPVGPVTLDELHANRLRGTVTPETYVIEHTGEAGGVVGSWRRYREVFPESATSASLPPLPASISPPPPLPSQAAHPLFPSASHPAAAPPVFPTGTTHTSYPARQTNTWCAWGFGLGLAGFIFSFACGLGLLLAAPALLICILGFAQVQRHNEQSGRGLAAAGAVLSLMALLISIGILAWGVPLAIKHQMIIEQSSSSTSNSE